MEEKYNSQATTGCEAPPSSSTETPPSRRRGGGLKRKASNLSNSNTSTPPMLSSSKRQARDKPSPVLFPPIHNGPCTRARQNPNYADSTSFWDAVVVRGEGDHSASPTRGTAAAAVKVEEELKSREEAWGELEAKIEADYAKVKSRDVNAHVVPIPSGWFTWTKVHPLEERALPSFFNGKSEKRTPEIYMEIRNSIMNKFHANPNMQIEVKDLSDLSVGELDARQEVMEFLDYWGLINYHPFPDSDTTTSIVDADEVAKVDSLIQKLYQFETAQSCSPAIAKTSSAAPSIPSRLLPESMITEEYVQPEGPSVEYHCNSCSADCSRKRYHCQKQADFDLCTECFNGRKFDSDMSPSDFILMEPADAAGASSGKWTDQETLLLLEALELFSENWNEIAEHVATKTKAQCILHFVQMPIEDTFLDRKDEFDVSHKANAEEKEVASEKGNAEKKEDDASIKENVNADADADGAAAKSDTPSSVDPEVKETKDSKTPSSNDVSPQNDAVTNDDQPVSSPMDISESVEPSKPKDNLENGGNMVVKALRDAFEAVGSLPSPKEKLSFADAGNPVMALAAFLGRLAEPNTVTASARNSLKSVSGNSCGLQLSARHSFLIEDPTDEKKSDDTGRDVEKLVEQQALKDETDSNGKQKEEKSSLSDGNGSLNENKDNKDKDLIGQGKELSISAEKHKDLVTRDTALSNSPEKDKNKGSEEKGISASPRNDSDLVGEGKVQFTPSNDGCTKKSGGATESNVPATDEVKSSAPNELNSLELRKEQGPNIAEETEGQTSQVQDPSSSKKESSECPPVVGATQSTEAPKEEEMVSIPSEKTEPHQSNKSTSVTENVTISGEAEAKDNNNETEDPVRTIDDVRIHKMKHAAVTAIAAAAVKAKFLADQEEDQIRQLATSLIEKQLRKLETKLAIFTEMDGVIARARELLERSKQKLYHERAQIIAARLSMSSSSARPMSQSLSNRLAMAFPNAGQRPPNPMSMTPQRPPFSRPMMAPMPPVSNPVVSSTAAGNSVQISNNLTDSPR